MADNKTNDQELEGFENPDDVYAGAEDDGAAMGDDIDDAEFQDMADALNEDVFEEDTPPAAKPKKGVSWFNIVIAVIAIAGAGGLIVMKLAPQLLGGAATDVSAPVVAETTVQSPESAAQEALAPIPAPAQGGMLDNPDAFAQLTQDAVPAPALAAAEPIPDPFAAMDNNSAAAPEVPMPAPITAEPVAPTQIEVAEEAAPALETMPAPVMAEPVSTAIPAANNVQVNELTGRVDTLSSRMDSIESKLDAALAAAANNTRAASAPADDSRFDAIQNTLARLESRLDDLSSSARAKVREVVSGDEDRPAPVKKAKKSIPAKAKSNAGQWDDAYKPSGATPAVASAPSISSSSAWTLRGAQPGQAIIGGQNGDIRQVGLGDTVPGIGQVTGIAPINGRWVVQGTQGRISQ